MTKKQVEAVMSKIRELVPELMELSFGCKVEQTTDNTRAIHSVVKGMTGTVIKRGNERRIRLVSFHNLGEALLWNCPVKDYKVLGHPIYLRHVLEAICLKQKCDHCVNPSHLTEQTLIVSAWQRCGLLKSLNTLTEKNTEEARELFEFLDDIF